MMSMPNRLRTIAGLLCVAAFAITLGTASAVTTGSPVKVSKCEPLEGTVSAPAGFYPGYYPAAGPYYWRDVYGYRYSQFAAPTVSQPTLSIDYVNHTEHPIHTIEFGLVARGSLIAEVRDVGTFSQGVEIKHSFGLNPNVFPIGTGLPQCVPLRVTWHNGHTWVNPHLPRLQKSLYE